MEALEPARCIPAEREGWVMERAFANVPLPRSTESDAQQGFDVVLKLAADDTAHLMVLSEGAFYHASNAGGVWQAPSRTCVASFVAGADLALDASGNPQVLTYPWDDSSRSKLFVHGDSIGWNDSGDQAIATCAQLSVDATGAQIIGLPNELVRKTRDGKVQLLPLPAVDGYLDTPEHGACAPRYLPPLDAGQYRAQRHVWLAMDTAPVRISGSYLDPNTPGLRIDELNRELTGYTSRTLALDGPAMARFALDGNRRVHVLGKRTQEEREVLVHAYEEQGAFHEERVPATADAFTRLAFALRGERGLAAYCAADGVHVLEREAGAWSDALVSRQRCSEPNAWYTHALPGVHVAIASDGSPRVLFLSAADSAAHMLRKGACP